ncbi:MAG: aminopeptidase P family protein [Alphaproteobacteria bacterium]|nr:aminopeptidase P family protein [Alphaproteobacteria bacterium]
MDGLDRAYARIPPPFPAATYGRHLKLLQDDMRSRGLAALLLFDPESIFWLTGYNSIGYFTFQCAVVTPDGPPELVSRRVNRQLALALGTIGAFVAIEDTDDAVAILAGHLATRTPAGSAVGAETGSWYLTVQAYKALERSLDRRLVDWGGTIERARMRKTPEQVASMRRAATAAVAGMDAALHAIRPGCSENDLAAAMLQAATAAGSEYFRVPLVVAGPATGICFATWQRRPVARGDVVFLESAACIDRYHAIVARCATVGAASAEQRRRAGLIVEALDRAIGAIRPGITSGAVDAACRGVFERAGLGAYFDHRTAYAVGIGFPPNWAEGRFLALKPGDPTVLEPGMTFHIVPSLFMPDFGMCFSETVLVTETGCEALTQHPRRLAEVAC